MRKFSIVVNGTAYEVDVEEIGAGAAAPVVAAPAPVAAAPAPVAAPKAAPVKAAAPKAAAAPAGAAGAVQIKSPMPGTVLSIKVTAGQAVKKGDPVVMIEAMKMETPIPAPQDGTIASINTQQGATVASGDVLVTMN